MNYKLSMSNIHYTLSLARQNAHLLDVSMTFEAPSDVVFLHLPTWINGSYLVREFAKNLSQIRTHRGEVVPKVSKSVWRLFAVQGQTVHLNYSVFCKDVSVRTCYLDHMRAYLNLCACLVSFDDTQEATLTLIDLKDAKARIYGALEFECQDGNNAYWTQAAIFRLYDCPLEIGRPISGAFVAGEIDHKTHIFGALHIDMPRLKNDLGKICAFYHKAFGAAPFDRYTFLTYAMPGGYGGLEHSDSTSLICDALDLPGPGHIRARYLRYLGLCSHEYLHAWWVKAVHLTDLDHQREIDTTMLWAFEGFTSYLDDAVLYVSGACNADAYLELLSRQIAGYLNRPGRHHQSLIESAQETWIKLYRPDDNSQNATTSYYNQGALAALWLDVLLIEAQSCLLEVMRDCYLDEDIRKQGLDMSAFERVILRVLPKAHWEAFCHHALDSLEDLPIEAVLARFGVEMILKHKEVPFGLKIDDTGQVLGVAQAAALASGLSVGDVIVSLDGACICQDTLKSAYARAQGGDDICAVVKRHGRLLELNLRDTGDTQIEVTLKGTPAFLDSTPWRCRR